MYRNLRTCLRPQGHDDLPVLGPMSYYPNVYLNLNHGGHGTSISMACGKIVQEMIEGVDKSHFDQKIIEACHAKRALV